MSGLRWLAVLLIVFVPAPAFAWGFDAHRFIMERALPLLPPEIRPFFEARRDAFIERSIDPDTWRLAGFADEAPRHYLNLDTEVFGPDPYDRLPRDRETAVAQFGAAAIERAGLLPWRVEEMAARLTGAFEAAAQRPAARSDVLFLAAWLAHYVADAHVPFHAVVNYDGQLTGQRGIHARFETTLFERYRRELRVDPVALPPIDRPRDFIFDRLLEGTRLAPVVLEADRRARDGRGGYDNAYYREFFHDTRAILEARLAASSAAIAAMIAGAWVAAGRPPLPGR